MLISTVVVAWMATVLTVYRIAQHEVKEVFDADLARSARILQALLLHEVEEERRMAEQARAVLAGFRAEELAAHPYLARILDEYLSSADQEELELVEPAVTPRRYGPELAFVARYADGTEMLRDGSAPDLPLTTEGYSDLRLGQQLWRIYRLSDPDSGFVVQVGERQALRAELVGYITRNTLMPLLFALPILALLIWLVVGHALKPLQRVADEVSSRAGDALAPIDDADTPREIHALVRALNQLFDRVQSALRRERQFTADAAHELRTPLAVLKTNLQVALAKSREAGPRHALEQALAGVDRATHAVAQLLVLARADAQQTRTLLNSTVDLRDVAVGVVSAMSQPAYERDIDLGMGACDEALVRGDATALHLLLRNLVDNAVRYTPRGGVVTVGTWRDRAGSWVEVADDGVGVAVEQRAEIFRRFRRGAQAGGESGSGLGLSIVQRIADLHGAAVSLDDGLHGRGLTVRVCFPADAPERLPAVNEASPSPF